MAFHLCSSPHHRGPLIIIAVGFGFALVGAIPVAVNFALVATNSGTIIGVGFIGFGLLLLLPGLVWCVVQRLVGLRRVCDCCSCCGTDADPDIQEKTPALKTHLSRCSTIEASSLNATHDCLYDEDEDHSSPSIGTHIFITTPSLQRTDSCR